jgi:hypothetical protein
LLKLRAADGRSEGRQLCYRRFWMNRARVLALAAFALSALPWSSAHAGFFIGVGVPVPAYRPYYRPYYYGPRVVVGLPPVYVGGPVYVAQPAPVYVTPAPVYVTPAPAGQPAYAPAAPAPAAPASAAFPPAPVPVGR